MHLVPSIRGYSAILTIIICAYPLDVLFSMPTRYLPRITNNWTLLGMLRNLQYLHWWSPLMHKLSVWKRHCQRSLFNWSRHAMCWYLPAILGQRPRNTQMRPILTTTTITRTMDNNSTSCLSRHADNSNNFECNMLEQLLWQSKIGLRFTLFDRERQSVLSVHITLE